MKNINSSDVGSTGSNFSEWFEKEIHEPMKLHANYGSEYLDTHLAAIKVLTGAAFKAGESAQLKMMEWQPIETAPLDGTLVIIRDGLTVKTGHWSEISNGCWVDPEYGDDLHVEPTHWMPLPAAPAC